MNDPAVEAAQRAIGDVNLSQPYRYAEAGAREALKRIQQWYNDPNMAHNAAMWQKLKDLIFPDGDLHNTY